MSNSDKLEDCKKEIRSVLIPFQKGCYLSEFHGTYKGLVGRRLPVRDFGFRTDIEFLYSIPDVVKITPTRTGEYHLQAVADESVKHIQKMVAKQKPTKLRGPPLVKAPPPLIRRAPSRFSKSFVVPPRFSELKAHEPQFSQKPVPKEPKVHSTETFNSQKTLPRESKLLPTDAFNNNSQKTAPKKESTEISNNNSQLPRKLSPKEEVILLVQNFKNKIALDDLLPEYRRMFGKSLSLSQYGINSIEECIENIPELDIVTKNKVDFIVHRSEFQHFLESENLQEVTSGTDSIPPPQMPSTFSSDIGNITLNEDKVPTTFKKKLQQVAEKYSEGIWAADFPECFESVTSESLNFLGLGYRCLSDLIDDVPDIFIRKPVAGSRKDYIIYPAKSGVDAPMFIDHIIVNFRKILEAYPEGIKIKDILHVYNINTKTMLHIEDLGFDTLESFLLSVKDSIPLNFGFTNGEKSIHLKRSYTVEDLHREPPTQNPLLNIPSDAVLPQFVHFKHVTLPENFDYGTFVPVYVSTVAHAGHLYVQLQTDKDEEHFKEVSDIMESLYNSNKSDSYKMKSIHIKDGAFCVAKWPADNHWYRAQILSVSTMKAIRVLYVDYGTQDTVTMELLRYLKKDFIDLPVQAIKCRLSYLRPPKNAVTWDAKATRDRILELVHDTPLMAKFEMKSDGIRSVLLCDTNGEDDVFINDVLVNEGLAEYDILAESNQNIPAPVEPDPKIHMECLHNLNPLQALQAQYFLKAFAAVAPSFAQNEHYTTLLREVSVFCQSPDPVQQNVGMPLMAPVAPPGFNSIPPSLNTYSNSSAFYNTYSTGATVLEGGSNMGRANINPPVASMPADPFITASVEPEPLSFYKSLESAIGNRAEDIAGNRTENTAGNRAENATGNIIAENEIFDDDDDEIFQQFCQKVAISNKRHVKRAVLGDGYKIHIIAVDSTPYASSGDIAQLIWNNKEADYLFRRLEVKEVDIPAVSLSEDGNEELFQQLKKFNVKGVQNITGYNSSISLFPLKCVIKILNIFGHPSITLRTRLMEELSLFDPNEPYWQDFSPDVSELEDEDGVTSGVTDDDKIERLCLYDLLAMKESIMCKKKRILNNQCGAQSDEIYKLEQLQVKVLSRIQEIKEICEEFDR